MEASMREPRDVGAAALLPNQLQQQIPIALALSSHAPNIVANRSNRRQRRASTEGAGAALLTGGNPEARLILPIPAGSRVESFTEPTNSYYY
jgi:hypothetical protein